MNEFLDTFQLNMPTTIMPDPDEISYYKLEKERKYYLDDVVDSSLMGLHRMILRWNMEDAGKKPEDRKPIWIYVMSPGGEGDVMWALLDVIKASITPVYTVNVGIAASAASLIFIAGHKRFMMPNARVIIHEGSAQFGGDAVKVMDASESYKKELKRMKDYILEHSGIKPAQLNRKRNNDWELDAQFCIENNVCDKIIESIEEVI